MLSSRANTKSGDLLSFCNLKCARKNEALAENLTEAINLVEVDRTQHLGIDPEIAEDLFIRHGAIAFENAIEIAYKAIEENPDTVLAPDFAFITKDRLQEIPPKGYLRFAPDLVVETRSPSDTQIAFALKIARWLSAGTQVVWALEPANQTISVHRSGVTPLLLTIEDKLTEEHLLPGFSLSLRHLFRPISHL